MKDLLQRDLHDNDWIGIIVNTKDSLCAGRCQIRVFSLMDDIDLELVPWASPINSTVFGTNGAGSLSVPKVGQIVRVQFNNGDIYAPEYTTIQNIDSDLIAKIKDDYDGTHVLLYDFDAELSILYQPKLGIQIYLKESFFQISPDSMITMQTPNADAIMQFEGDKVNLSTKNEVNVTAGSKVTVVADESVFNGKNTTKIGPGPYNHAMLAEPSWALIATLASAIDTKYPPTPGVNAGLVNSAKQSGTSQNVLISK